MFVATITYLMAARELAIPRQLLVLVLARGLLLAAAPRNDWGNYQLLAGMAKFSRLAFAGSHYWVSLVFSAMICTI